MESPSTRLRLKAHIQVESPPVEVVTKEPAVSYDKVKAVDGDESDMSSVYDVPPPKRRKKCEPKAEKIVKEKRESVDKKVRLYLRVIFVRQRD